MKEKIAELLFQILLSNLIKQMSVYNKLLKSGTH